MDDTKFILCNIYMPYQTPENDDKYLKYLTYLKKCLYEITCTIFVIIGD